MVKNLSNREIAARLEISSSTAKNHAVRVMKKLELKKRADIILFASKCGFDLTEYDS